MKALAPAVLLILLKSALQTIPHSHKSRVLNARLLTSTTTIYTALLYDDATTTIQQYQEWQQPAILLYMTTTLVCYCSSLVCTVVYS